MQAFENTPRTESILVRLERHIAAGTDKDEIARQTGINPNTIGHLLKRESIYVDPVAWDNPIEAIDKLEKWLEFEYDDRAEAVLSNIESRLAAGLTRERLANEAGIRLDSLEFLLKRMKGFGRNVHLEKPGVAMGKLETWLAEEEAQTGPKAAPLAETPTFKSIQKYLSMAHAGRRLIAITGDVGIGKSEAARAYAAAHPKTDRTPGAIYVEFSELDGKPLAAMQRILKALPVRASEAPKHEYLLLDHLAAVLKPGDLLILDECNHLTGKKGTEGRALSLIRDLHERSRAGVAMLGNPDLKNSVWGGKQDFAALASRTDHFPLTNTTEADVDAWMQWAGFIGKPLRKSLVRLAARPGQNGGLRAIARLVETHVSFFPGRPIEPGGLEEIARAMGRL